jgi:hypothetical protein
MQRLFKDVRVLELERNYDHEPETLWIYTRPTHDKRKIHPNYQHVKLQRQFGAEGTQWPIRRWFFAQQTAYEFDHGLETTGVRRGWISDRHKIRYTHNMVWWTSQFSICIQEKYPELHVPGVNNNYRPHLDPHYVILSRLSHTGREIGKDGVEAKEYEEQFNEHETESRTWSGREYVGKKPTPTPAKPIIHMPQITGLDARWKMLEAYAAGYGDRDVLAMFEDGDFE